MTYDEYVKSRCPNRCGYRPNEHDKFCSDCGGELVPARRCHSCKSLVFNHTFCAECGMLVGQLPTVNVNLFNRMLGKLNV